MSSWKTQEFPTIQLTRKPGFSNDSLDYVQLFVHMHQLPAYRRCARARRCEYSHRVILHVFTRW